MVPGMRPNRKSRRTEITVEHHEIVIVRRPCDPVRCWCKDCGAEVDMVVAEQAAYLAEVAPRTVYRWLEADKLHYLEGQDGSVLICAPSISRLTRSAVSPPAPVAKKPS
jgi:hypothetical protein